MADPVTEPASPPTGYGFLLPEDWAQIPLRQGDAEDAVRSLVASAFARVPADGVAVDAWADSAGPRTTSRVERRA